MKYSLFLFCLFTALACSKSDSVTPSNELVGTWRLSSYCKPATSSTCTPVDVPTNKRVLISFANDGSFGESYENTNVGEYAFLGCGSGDYKLEGNNVRIRALCMSSMNGRLIPLVSIEANRLVMNPFGTGNYIFVKQ